MVIYFRHPSPELDEHVISKIASFVKGGRESNNGAAD